MCKIFIVSDQIFSFPFQPKRGKSLVLIIPLMWINGALMKDNDLHRAVDHVIIKSEINFQHEPYLNPFFFFAEFKRISMKNAPAIFLSPQLGNNHVSANLFTPGTVSLIM